MLPLISQKDIKSFSFFLQTNYFTGITVDTCCTWSNCIGNNSHTHSHSQLWMTCMFLSQNGGYEACLYTNTTVCVCACVWFSLNPVFPSHISHGEKFLSSHSVTQMLLTHVYLSSVSSKFTLFLFPS